MLVYLVPSLQDGTLSALHSSDTPFQSQKSAALQPTPFALALRAALIYLVIGTLWILLSDRILNSLVPDQDTVSRLQSYKGLFFVKMTTVVLFVIILLHARSRQRVTRALLISEARQASAYQLVAIGLCQASADDGRFLRVNQRMCDITGYTEAELLKLCYSDITHPDDRDKDVEKFTAMVTGRTQAYEAEKRYLRKDGRTICVHVNATLVNDSENPKRTVAVVQDITGRVEALKKLRASESRFRELADAMPQMVFVAGADGLVEYVNQQWHDYTGCTLEQARTKAFADTFHPDDRRGAIDAWMKIVHAGEGIYEHEFRLRRAYDQSFRWHLVRAMPSFDEEGRIAKWFGTITDIHDLRRAKEDVVQLNETLEHRVQQRTAELQAVNEELDAFAYTVSHDLRAPLRSQQAFNRQVLLTDEKNLSEESKNLLRRTLAANVRMDRFITDLLDYSHLSRQELKLQPVSTVTIVHELIGQLERDPSTASAKVLFREPLPWVMGNRLMVQMVFSNLVENAIKFVRPGQTPQVQIWAQELPSTAKNQTPFVRIWIEDNGLGIPPADFNRVFSPFETLHRQGTAEGIGIGLSIVKRTVERMNGKVGVESTEGVGSKFWIELPIALPD